jgi:RNA polymerase sigma-70 factor (ECF subfamily)
VKRESNFEYNTREERFSVSHVLDSEAENMDAVMPGLKVAPLAEAPPLALRAFDEVYGAHKEAVYRLACALTGNAREAEDLFQETWLRAVRARGTELPAGNARAWLFTIAANLHRDALRKKKIRRLFFLERARKTADGAADADPGWDASRPAGREIEARADFRSSLRRAVSRLTARERQVFVLKDIEGYRHQEIGRMLGIPEATVRTLLHRATRKLQKDLASFRPGDVPTRRQGNRTAARTEEKEP